MPRRRACQPFTNGRRRQRRGLVGYGPRVVEILRGAKPADPPVEQPTNFELVINLPTAKEIGHEVSAGLVPHGDKLVE